MEYIKAKDMYTYSGQANLKLPKGSPTGHRNVLYLITPDENACKEIITSPFMQLKQSMYKYYYIDYLYKSKIGFTTIKENNSGAFIDFFDENLKPEGFIKVKPGEINRIMGQQKNLIVDLGHWMSLWLQNRRVVNLHDTCAAFIDLILSQITRLGGDPAMDNYDTKILYVPLDINSRISFKVAELTNPLSIIMCCVYKFPDLCAKFNGYDILFVDLKNKQFMKVAGSSLSKDNYNTILTQLKKFVVIKGTDTIAEDLDEEIKPNLVKENTPKELGAVTQKVIDNINDELMKNISADDITEDEEVTTGLTDEEEVDIQDVIAKVMDEADEDETGDELVQKATISAKQKVFLSKFTPDRSASQVKKMEELAAQQLSVFTEQTADVIKSKEITKLQIGDEIDTINESVKRSAFANFDKSYNEKKLKGDINNAVGKLASCDYPVYVTSVDEKDTSDSLNLKKTLTYHLEDINGRKMSFKVDIPIIIDDSYIIVNGGKKIIGHQHMLRPIVKSSPDEVQLVTFYGKSFMKRKGESDILTNRLKKYIISNEDKFKVRFGNMYLRNKGLPSTLEIDTFAKNISEFTVGDNVIVFNFHKINEILEKRGISMEGFDDTKHILIGYNKKKKTCLYINPQDSFTRAIISLLSEEDIAALGNIKSKGNLIYTNIKILNKVFPLIYLMLYCEGFTSVMEKAKIDYKIVPKEEVDNYHVNEWGTILCSDAAIMWKRYPIRNTLLMNGFSKLNVIDYTVEELDDKETYIDMVTLFAEHTNTAFNLDQWKNFVLDDVTKEILADFNYPTDLIEVLAYCNSLLTTNTFLDINNEENLRIRSNEVIAEILYEKVAEAYNVYRKSLHHKAKKDISVKRDCVIKELVTGLETVDEASVLNPILELEKRRSVTYKGSTGINIERAISLKRRAYNDSMIGICGISSSNDAKVGINRQLTVNPNITSTRGYVQVTDKKNIDDLDAAQLLTMSEMLTPLTVRHDDPPRTGMTFKQSQYMLPVKSSSPVLIGNKMETMVPYHNGSNFSRVAKNDGKVIDEKNGVYVIQYVDGTYDSFDTNESVVRNASQGFFLTAKMDTDLKVGDNVKKNQVVAWHNRFFKKNENDIGASMTLGVLTKIAVMPQSDQYEDSVPITKKLSEELASDIVVEKKHAIPFNATIRNIRQIGEQIKTGEPLCVYDSSTGDVDVDAWLSGYSEALQEEILEATASTIRSKYSGEIIDIRIISTVPIEDLSDSLQEVVKAYHKRVNDKTKVLQKYSNDGDSKYYKCGQVISESTEIVKPNAQGKVKGERVEEGVVITFYIKFTDRMKKGDKLSQYSALKGIVSDVIKEGDEQYSSFRPKEEISTSLAPGAILARKTPSVFLAMFGNKVLIEQKRKMKSIYFETPFNDTY